jgi:hypothetical protein
MIGVAHSTKRFPVLARYLVEGRTGEAEGRVAWVASRNLPTDDPVLGARIMRATAAQNVRVTEPVYHLVVSFHPTDAVDRAVMERVADRLLGTLWLQEHQVVLVAHADRPHPHVHLLVNRVHPETGKAWCPWQDHPAIQRVLREEEEALGLWRVRPGRERDPTADLAENLRTYERLVELGRKRYHADLEMASAQARFAQLDAAAERTHHARHMLEQSFRAVHRDPDHALGSFLEASGRDPAGAVGDLRETPERFGELLSAERATGRGRSRSDDPAARAAARTAAVAGREVIDAEGAFSAAIAQVRNGRAKNSGAPAVDGSDQERADAHATVRADIERIQVNLRKLRAEEQRLPAFHLLERALARGLCALSPPVLDRLRLVVTGAQFSLARKLRHMAQDVALGRDDEM